MKKNIYGLLLLVMLMMIPTLQVNAQIDSTDENILRISEVTTSNLDDLYTSNFDFHEEYVKNFIRDLNPDYECNNGQIKVYYLFNDLTGYSDNESRYDYIVYYAAMDRFSEHLVRPYLVVNPVDNRYTSVIYDVVTDSEFTGMYYGGYGSVRVNGQGTTSGDLEVLSDNSTTEFTSKNTSGNSIISGGRFYNWRTDSGLTASQNGMKVFNMYTNIPIFFSTDTESIEAYRASGDTSGAENAKQIENIVNPKDEVTYSNDLKLKNLQYYGTYLDLGPAVDKYCSFEYWPVYDGFDLDNMCIEVSAKYDSSYSIANIGEELTHYTASYVHSFPLVDCRNGIKVFPYSILHECGWSDALAMAAFGGSVFGADFGLQLGDGVSLDAASVCKIESSLMSISLRLVSREGRKVVASSKAYTQDLNLLTGECEFHYSNIDENTNEYVKDENPYKTTDKDGNTKVNNTVEGGNNSSANGGTGGNATIGDINNNNTIKFPDHITVDLNVNGIVPSNTIVNVSGGGTSSGSSADSSSGAKLPTFVQNAGNGLSTFMQYLFSGFGMFDSSSGIVQLLQASFPYIPSEYWQVFIFGAAAVVFGSIIAIFFRR